MSDFWDYYSVFSPLPSYGDSVVTPGGRKVNWKAVRRCTGITRHGCDLSDETRDLEHEYLARVRATTRTGFSAWATTRRRFHPKADSKFTPGGGEGREDGTSAR